MSDAKWEPTYHAFVWWCGDDECDCHQPTIELRTPNLTVGRPWVRITTLWQGTFTSGGFEPDEPSLEDLEAELKAECDRRGIPVGLSKATDVTWEQVREIDRAQMAEAKQFLDRYVSR